MKFHWPAEVKPTDHPSVLFRTDPASDPATPPLEDWQLLKQQEEQENQRRIARQAARREALQLIQLRAETIHEPAAELLDWLREQAGLMSSS
ncbi:hypothetical protein IGB42_00806 [Andreprevotia sp. IGB-42]|uniref:hypothetical protein n=1 Tax=Andreprevotia sp. IGB-42 TaxID=2497473 RepID=UPI00135913DA|nr:hypothetical protein [Andreprevotia sp. IGB-42]KAF0814751.1 hypothetical protein IGB42_00806 [Andreprevotia sp. IGB-42]